MTVRKRPICAKLLATIAIGLATVFASPASASAKANATASQVAADDESLLEYAQGEPITASEHARLVAQTRGALRKYPHDVERADALLRDVVAKLRGVNPAEAETIREEIRLRLAMLPQSTLEWQILEKHDPTVASDRAHGQAVTARTIVVIEHATLWLAKQLAIAGPGDNFVTTETAYIRDNFTHFTSDERDACSHIARNMAASVESYDSLSPKQRKARLARTRSVLSGSLPLDAIAVLSMARAYTQTSWESRFLATTSAMFQLQNTNQLVMGLEGLQSGSYAPHL